MNKNWSANKFPPFFVRALKKFQINNIEPPSLISVPLISPLPPWFNINEFCSIEFSDSNVGDLSNTVANAIFNQNRESLYRDFCEIFTDGSKVKAPEVGSSAGLIIKLDNNTIMKNYKLPPEMSIMGCELYAIIQALSFIRNNVSNIIKNDFVIHSDSLSGILAILNREPDNQRHLIYEIHDLIYNLSFSCNILKIQFVPGHKDIQGNELADLAANAAHSNELIESVNISKQDKVRTIEKGFLTLWQKYWDNMVRITGKGKHLQTIRSKIGFWPWSCHKVRTIETVFTKLRIGHVNTNTHLFRFQLTTSLVCRCGQSEDINHIFISCAMYAYDRTVFYDELNKLGVPFKVKNLLGGGDFDISTQNKIIELTAKFLLDIKKLHVL